MVDAELDNCRVVRKRDEEFGRRVVQYLTPDFPGWPSGLGSKNARVRDDLLVDALALRIESYDHELIFRELWVTVARKRFRKPATLANGENVRWRLSWVGRNLGRGGPSV